MGGRGSGGIINVYHHQGQGGGAFALQSIDLKLEGREVSGCGPAFFIERRLQGSPADTGGRARKLMEQ